jgi:Ser/Thr protein kinase RdoA (MazF antagonist)
MMNELAPSGADPVALFAATVSTLSAPLPLDVAEASVRAVYGLEVAAERLTGERDQNFHLRDREGRSFLLKLTHPAENPAIVEMTSAALLHLERNAPALPCPRLIPGLDGALQHRLGPSRGGAGVMRVLTWLPGRPVRQSPRSAGQRAACGRLAAQMAQALRDFHHPAARRPLIWDLRAFPHVRRLLADVPEMPHAQAAHAFFERYETAAAPVVARLRRQLLHNDLNAKNVIVSPDDEALITGVIDFGDLTDTAVAADAAIAASGHIGDIATLESDLRDFLCAYHSQSPLTAEEWGVLNWLIAARKMSDLVIPYWYQAKAPGSDHYQPKGADEIERWLQVADALTEINLAP